MHGDAGGVNLHIRGVGKDGALAVASDGSRGVAAHGVGREEIGVAVAAGADHHSVRCEAFELSGDEIACNDAACASVDDDKIEHLVACVEFDGACVHLAHERGVGAEEKLLTGLAFGVEGAAHLCTAEGAVGQHAAIFACEGHTLCHTLVDDGVGHLSETINVGFACTIVATFHRIVEEAIDRVAVVLVVLGCIDTALGRNGVCTAG